MDGNKPLFIPGMPKLADSEAIIKSQVKASCKPAAVTELSTAQSVIKPIFFKRSMVFVHWLKIFSGFVVFLS